ncbi:Sec1 family protein [Spironucleus salmonicida]|uniref:Sec1 family protein n=1 Tax=Spironucleus salmonicida TaxID=348837 RepID=V6LP80_9EUKA|nr:Sec1 family protein [Spironucleus salmonicida]|eukprot:EST46487.1 Sec1 family protein [Spironucleus salmonicida]
MYLHQQKSITKFLSSSNFKTLVTNQTGLCRSLLPQNLMRKMSFCATSKLDSQATDLANVSELVFVILEAEQGEAIQLINQIRKYLAIQIVQIPSVFPHLPVPETQKTPPANFRAISLPLIEFFTPNFTISTLESLNNSIFHFTNSTGYGTVKSHVSQAFPTCMSGPSLHYISRDLTLFNKFRTFTSYGALVFEYFEKISKEEAENQIEIEFTILLTDAIFCENLALDFAEFAQILPKIVNSHKIKQTEAKRTQNLHLIQEVENEKSSIDLHVRMSKNLMTIIQEFGLYQLKEVENEILSGFLSVENTENKLKQLKINDKLREKFCRLYGLVQGSNLLGSGFKVQKVMFNDGLLDRLNKKALCLKTIVGQSVKGFEFQTLSQGNGKLNFAYIDGSCCLGELIELGGSIGCQAITQWWE